MINQIIAEIEKNESFKNICKRLAGNRDVWQDLFQDVLLKLYLQKERTLKAKEEDRLDRYVISSIYNHWIDENKRVKQGDLKYIADNYGLWSEYKERLTHDNSRYLAIKAVNELKKKIASGEDNEGANLLWRACQSNIYTVSKEENTSFYQIRKKIQPTIKQIKRKLDE